MPKLVRNNHQEGSSNEHQTIHKSLIGHLIREVRSKGYDYGRKEKEMKKILCIIGAVLVFGAIGAEQTEAISFTQSLVQCVIGLPMFAIGVM